MSAGDRPSRRARIDASFEGIYRRHRTEVYRSTLRKLGDPFEAEDVTQTAFLDAYGAILRGAEPEIPRAWLLAIAENVRRRRFRVALRRPREEPLDELADPRDADEPLTADLVSSIASLPANQRSAFLLREVGGLSYGEIAERLELTVASVQMLLFRARQTLRAELGETTLLDRARQAILVPATHWLSSLASRLLASTATARSLSAAGGAALVLAGVSGGESGIRDVPRTATRAQATSPAYAQRPSDPAAPLAVVTRAADRPARAGAEVAPALNPRVRPAAPAPGSAVAASEARSDANAAEAATRPSAQNDATGQPTAPLPPLLEALGVTPSALTPPVVPVPALPVAAVPTELPLPAAPSLGVDLPADHRPAAAPPAVPATAAEVGGALAELSAP